MQKLKEENKYKEYLRNKAEKQKVIRKKKNYEQQKRNSSDPPNDRPSKKIRKN